MDESFLDCSIPQVGQLSGKPSVSEELEIPVSC